MLHVGGVHEAMTVAPPPELEALATPLVLTLTDADWDELQVSGMPLTFVVVLMTLPTVSVTVGTIVLEVLVEPVTCSAID